MTLFQPRESRIFKDARWLQPLSEPPGRKPLSRDEDLKLLAGYLTEVFETGSGRNILVYGRPGTGKTLCVHYLLEEARRYAGERGLQVLMVYVNAGRTRNPYYTMLEIVRALGVAAPDSGWQMSKLKQAFEGTRAGRPMIIAIDEVDTLLSKEREPLVYYLNRQPAITLLLVSNRFEDAAALPDRAMSTLQPRFFKLEPYTAEEARTILAERAEKAFHPGVLPDELLSLAAKVAATTGDIRDGFQVLLQAGHLAEREGSPVIESGHLTAAAESELALEIYKERLERLRRLKQRP